MQPDPDHWLDAFHGNITRGWIFFLHSKLIFRLLLAIFYIPFSLISVIIFFQAEIVSKSPQCYRLQRFQDLKLHYCLYFSAECSFSILLTCIPNLRHYGNISLSLDRAFSGLSFFTMIVPYYYWVTVVKVTIIPKTSNDFPFRGRSLLLSLSSLSI